MLLKWNYLVKNINNFLNLLIRTCKLCSERLITHSDCSLADQVSMRLLRDYANFVILESLCRCNSIPP